MPDPRSYGPNPWTGLNNRGFPEGGYDNKAAFDATLARLREELEPTRFALEGLRYWRDAGNPGFAIVRLDISENGGQPESHDVHVPNTGFEAWGTLVFETLLAWVRAFIEARPLTTPVPMT